MTDKSKYSNITVDNGTSALAGKLQTLMFPGVTISKSKVAKVSIEKEWKRINGKLTK
jgi:hypothetical protein|tara:strand:+ start:293 stop:463 length:171 start_codon:yes stop_codon:yes gene_type:complete